MWSGDAVEGWMDDCGKDRSSASASGGSGRKALIDDRKLLQATPNALQVSEIETRSSRLQISPVQHRRWMGRHCLHPVQPLN
jgi:hypothetical protein